MSMSDSVNVRKWQNKWKGFVVYYTDVNATTDLAPVI